MHGFERLARLVAGTAQAPALPACVSERLARLGLVGHVGRPLRAPVHFKRVAWAAASAVFALLAAGTLPSHAGELAPWTGGVTPPLAARTLAGDEIRLPDFAGRVVLVNFWATWCAPCVAEMPSLQRLRERLGAQRAEVIAVNYQENAARIEPFMRKLGLAFPAVRDHDGALRKAWNVTVFPSTFVIAPDGRVAYVAVGEIDWDDPTVESRLRSLR